MARGVGVAISERIGEQNRGVGISCLGLVDMLGKRPLDRGIFGFGNCPLGLGQK